MMNHDKNSFLRNIPGVDYLIEETKKRSDFRDIPPSVVKTSIRVVLEELRKRILDGKFPGNRPAFPDNRPALKMCDGTTHQDIDSNCINGEPESLSLSDIIICDVLKHSLKITAPRLVPAINATGVVLHTNLGRALLCRDALDRIEAVARGFSNLEFDIEKGRRGERYSAVEGLLCELTGAQAAMVVNNNAGAVFLSLDTLAKGKEVIVSRGELVEIGGSFRIPDVMEKSGCRLREVGTTNRTHPRDYESAINENTALLLKVHTSNYRIEGFTSSVSLTDLKTLSVRHGVPVMEDLGSGSLIDLSRYGLAHEPTVSDAVASGADVVTFSGDKLLGGPQAGIIVGSADVVKKIKSNPLTRALRIDKMTLAALEATLSLYRDEPKALREIPTLRMLIAPYEEIALKAEKIMEILSGKISGRATVESVDLSSRTGGGSYPEFSIPSRGVTIQPKFMSAASLENRMRLYKPAIIGRIENDRFIIDPRTLQEGEEITVCDAITDILSRE